jgi:murein DD-endopeptidase MepM/ murein hydrolase activator NlpD
MRRAAIATSLAAAAGLGVGVAMSQSSARESSACTFDFPVGAPDATGYYDAQPFGANYHLGNDWNGNAGGDADHGAFVFAIGDGVVTDATDYGGGWGNVVRVVHPCGGHLESLYAHLDRIHVVKGARVARGQPIGTIGTAGGHYPAHLHFELRDRLMPLGPGYAADRTGYLDPTAYITRHRAAR